MKGRHARGGRVFVLATLVFTLGMLQGGLVHAQGAEGRSYIQVTDANGASVTDLNAEDFTIKQGDVEVKILRIELLNQPLRLAVLVDDAEGARAHFRHLRDGLPAFVDALPEDSQVELILLSGRARTVVEHTEGLAKVKERVEEFFVDASRAAGFFDGVRETVAEFEGVRWPVMALITTDGPSMSATSFTEGKYEALGEQIQELGVTVHAMVLNTPDGRGFQTGVARQLTQMTGGWYDSLNGPSQALVEKLTAMATEISHRQAATANQYLVVYEPAPGATPNTLISAGVRRTQLRLRVSSDGRPQPITLGASTESLLTDAAEGGREEFWNAAEQAFASGDINVAAELYEKAHQADTQWGKPLFKLGLVSLNKGDIEAALQYFEQVVEVDPRSAEADQAKTVISQLK